MRSTLAAALVLAAIAALGASASATGIPPEVDGTALPLAALNPHAQAGPANPADLPEVTGPSALVGRAAALVASPATWTADDLSVLAAEQQLRAALEPTRDPAWNLGRFLPPVPSMPTASATSVTVQPLLGAAPAQAAVAAIAVAGAMSLVFPKLPLLPLYSRIEREEAMLNHRRSQLYDLVRAEPGIHLSDLVRRSGLGWGAALYHLGVLEKSRVLVAHNEGGFKRYFANGVHHREEQTRLVALRHGPARALFDAVQSAPGRSGRELAGLLGLSPSTLARASDRLEDAGLVKRVRAGRRVLYFPAQPETLVPAAGAAAIAA